MIRTYRFEKYEDQALLDFVLDLINHYEMGQIRFIPYQRGDLFNTYQLKHIAPNWDINHPNGFLGVWRKNRQFLKVVSFELFHLNGIPKIKMIIDLKAKNFVLESAEGITVEDVETSLKKFFKIKDGDTIGDGVNKWWKYTHPVWWIWFGFLFIFRDGILSFFKYVWNYGWVKWLVANIAVQIIIAVIAGIIVVYIAYKFKWNGL